MSDMNVSGFPAAGCGDNSMVFLLFILLLFSGQGGCGGFLGGPGGAPGGFGDNNLLFLLLILMLFN